MGFVTCVFGPHHGCSSRVLLGKLESLNVLKVLVYLYPQLCNGGHVPDTHIWVWGHHFLGEALEDLRIPFSLPYISQKAEAVFGFSFRTLWKTWASFLSPWPGDWGQSSIFQWQLLLKTMASAIPSHLGRQWKKTQPRKPHQSKLCLGFSWSPTKGWPSNRLLGKLGFSLKPLPSGKHHVISTRPSEICGKHLNRQGHWRKLSVFPDGQGWARHWGFWTWKSYSILDAQKDDRHLHLRIQTFFCIPCRSSWRLCWLLLHNVLHGP